MKSKIFLVIFFLFFSASIWAEEYKNTTIMEKLSVIKDALYQDYKNYFAGNGLGISLIIAGVLANTSIDREIQEWYQNSLRSNDTDNFSKIIKPLGDGRKTIPVYLGTALLGEIFKNTKLLSIIGEWGRRSTRAILTGVFPMLFFQRALGASRPEENDSHWRICEDNNGVSGHSFMGAIPFITAAKMTYNPYLKYFLYLGSTLCGLSRINDNAHYLSQVVLGWYMAYLAATSVDMTNKKMKKIIMPISPIGIKNGLGIRIIFRF